MSTLLRTPFGRSFFVVAIVLLYAPVVMRAAEPVDYARDVLPILSDNCYHCHGPDEQTREADLRLDKEEGAAAVLVAGAPDDSELIRRILSDDEAERMPPPDSNRHLTDQQKETLRRWVQQGAVWGQHWSFRRLSDPVPPQLRPDHQAQVINPIDNFVLRAIEDQGLDGLSPPARRERLIRRLTLDLTGLPPTLEEIAAFVNDPAPDAYERLVDRLLASPRFGERMASEWLDVARFADTHGYQFDRFRPMWPYRDWVINALNRNMPYDQFVTEQLAGDLLPGATKQQKLATAFNRLHMQNEEGGIVEEEFRVAYVNDRVTTFGTAMLGLTFECARCHDHKYDPITQQDFYSLFAFFQNIDESGQTSYFTAAMPVPTLLLSTDEQDQQLAAMEQKIQQSAAALSDLRNAARQPFAQWLELRPQQADLPGLVASYSFEALEDGKLPNAIDPSKPAVPSEAPELVEGQTGQGVLLSGENGFSFPGVGHFRRSDPFSIGLWLQTPDHSPRHVVLHHSRAPIDAGSRGYELLLEEGHVAFGLHHMWPGNSLKVRSQEKLTPGTWTHVTVTYDGSSRAAGVHVYLDGQPAHLDIVRDGLWKDITYAGGEPDLALGWRFRDNGFKGGRADELRIFDRQISALEAAHLAERDDLKAALQTPREELTDAQTEQLFEYFFAAQHAPAHEARATLQKVRREQSDFIEPIAEAMVMQEMPEPKPAYILVRGSYDQPGELVSADTPAALPPLADDAPRNRLGLAQWLFQPDHPLTSRVAVNRYWQLMFGRGIVHTADNFGAQGATPSHPELLDYLAQQFIASGWDVKALLRMMAMSATYRQDTRVTELAMARDPDNIYLSRGPSRRLTAEMLRDQALAVSGLLVERIGGPSVKPYQPTGLWDIAMGGPHYDQSTGAGLYRRSLYTFWKRTVPPPAMVTLDAAERNVCSVSRQATSTPLQSLVLLNDPQLVEAARHVAQRMLLEGGTTLDQQVAWVFQLIAGRPATGRESEILQTIYQEQYQLFAAHPEEAQRLLKVGEAAADSALDPAQVAAACMVAQAILNHDEVVMRR